MTRHLYYFIALLLLFSCTQKDGPYSQGPGSEVLSECVVQSSAKQGEEVIVQWTAFPEDPELYLVAKDGTMHPVEVEYVTSSGLVFIAPVTLSPGRYLLFMKPYELGEIEIEDAGFSVIGLSVPKMIYAKGVLNIKGIGFDSSYGVTLRSSDGESVSLAAELQPSSISVTLPADMATGTYSVYLTRGETSLLVSENLFVTRKKKLTGLRIVEPYFPPTYKAKEWRIGYDGDELAGISLVEGTLENDVYEWGEEEVYEKTGEYSFSVRGGEDACSTNNVAFEYIVDDGVIIRADVLRWGSERYRPYTWNYNADGTLRDITFDYKETTMRAFWYVYDSGDIVEAYTAPFVYGDEPLKNNPYAPSAVACFCAINLYSNEPFQFFPFLLGWLESPAVNLPSIWKQVAGATAFKDVPLEYEFDEDGYVTAITLKGENTVIMISYSE